MSTKARQRGGLVHGVVAAVLLASSSVSAWLLMVDRPFAAWCVLCAGFMVAGFLGILAKPEHGEEVDDS